MANVKNVPMYAGGDPTGAAVNAAQLKALSQVLAKRENKATARGKKPSRIYDPAVGWANVAADALGGYLKGYAERKRMSAAQKAAEAQARAQMLIAAQNRAFQMNKMRTEYDLKARNQQQQVPANMQLAQWYMNLPPEKRAIYDNMRRSGANNVNVTNNLKGQGEALKTALSVLKPDIERANQIPGQLSVIRSARENLRRGIFSGPMAEKQTALARYGAKFLGLGDLARANETEDFKAKMKQVAFGLMSKLKGAMSNKELDFLEKAAGGNIELNEDSLERILYLQELAAMRDYRNITQKVQQVGGSIEGMTPQKVEALQPMGQGDVQAMGQEQFDWSRYADPQAANLPDATGAMAGTSIPTDATPVQLGGVPEAAQAEYGSATPGGSGPVISGSGEAVLPGAAGNTTPPAASGGVPLIPWRKVD